MMTTMVMMMKMVKQRGALWQVSAISIVVGRGGNKKSVSITPIVIDDHRCDRRADCPYDEYGDDSDDEESATSVVVGHNLNHKIS